MFVIFNKCFDVVQCWVSYYLYQVVYLFVWQNINVVYVLLVDY